MTESAMAGRESLLFFGGSFDPPHLGHMQLLENAIALVQPTGVMVVPAGVPPHKRASATPGALRLAMCECFRPLFAGLEVSDVELRRAGKSYTYDTLCEVLAQRPQAKLYLCMGGDMLASFTAWYRWQDILQMAVLVATGRGEKSDEELKAAADVLRGQGGQVLFAPGEVKVLSSTCIREGIAAGERDAYNWIPPPADEIVRENGLYSKTGIVPVPMP